LVIVAQRPYWSADRVPAEVRDRSEMSSQLGERLFARRAVELAGRAAPFACATAGAAPAPFSGAAG